MTLFIKKIYTFLILSFVFSQGPSYGDLTKAIEHLDREARAHFTDAMIIKRGDEILYQMHSKENWEPIAAWSITKSLVSLGIGFLYDEGKISLDQPIANFFPGWEEGRKAKITIRHLMNHTSGIEHRIDINHIMALLQSDTLDAASRQEIIDEPGTHFQYNNHAVNILSAIIEKISGKRTDLFLKEKFFIPLGIVDYTWDIDGAGRAIGMCGLHIRANDLIKIGEFMLHKGVWNGKRLISEGWILQSVAASTVVTDPHFSPLFDHCGLLWWINSDDSDSFSAVGFLGQYCAVFPKEGMIAVRQHDYKRHAGVEDLKEEHSFRSFLKSLL